MRKPRFYLSWQPALCVSVAVLALAACGGSSSGTQGSTGANTDAAARVLRAESALPPGQSGFVSLLGQAQGLLSGSPASYGPHIDDQREMYWSFRAKPAALGTRPGSPASPKAGVEIYRDDFGVPIIYANNTRDGWYGVGYAVATDRLFLLDGVRRTAKGTLAELTGCSAVPADIQQRVLAYTEAEYQAMFDRASDEAKASLVGYVDGVNAHIAEVRGNPSLLPAEYGLLTSLPEPITVSDVLASGVYITRFVAAEGGNEMANVALLKSLSATLGSTQAGKNAFLDFTWLDDQKAVVSVPAGGRQFSNHSTPLAARDQVFDQQATWAMSLPDTLATGAGTGASPAPAPCELPIIAMATSASSALASAMPREVSRPASTLRRWGDRPSTWVSASPHRALADRGALQASVARPDSAVLTRRVQVAMNELRAYLHGGSHAYAIAPSRTKSGGTLMVAGPQLGYAYPLLLVEFEINIPGMSARGASVPILPAVGIGYSNYAAWGLTTGYSKTIDSFIETLCSTAQQAKSECSVDQYFHDGQWKDMSCRQETIKYRAASQGLPLLPALLSSSAQACRTIHGPLVARDPAAGLGRSVSYAIWLRETETIEGIQAWARAKSFAEFDAAMPQVTWNENTVVATRDGHIAFYHPGLHAKRHPSTDMRLPIKGTGAFDFDGTLPFSATPQVRDPAQGYLANWNNKPALGWLDGEGLGSTSRPGGAGQRVTIIADLLASRRDWAFTDLMAVDEAVGTTDPRAREFLPLLQTYRASQANQLSASTRALIDTMLSWDRRHYAKGLDINDEMARDTPGATVFDVWINALRDSLFAQLRDVPLGEGSAYDRFAGVGSHVFDQSVMDNVALRILAPARSSIATRVSWANGRSTEQIISASMQLASSRLSQMCANGGELTPTLLLQCRRVHPRSQLCSLSGVIGPGSSVVPGSACVTMPYQDRGSWVQRVGFE
ncbi:MAG: penicillin acylase family protein [Paraperlucidibaca sp.]